MYNKYNSHGITMVTLVYNRTRGSIPPHIFNTLYMKEDLYIDNFIPAFQKKKKTSDQELFEFLNFTH